MQVARTNNPGGTYDDAYIDDARKLDVDHLVPLAESSGGRGRPAGAVGGGVRRAVASRRKAPWGFSRTIVPMGCR
ncbi:hypothetical protein ACFVGN_09175 [Streptomyces sp. NPDC057757]|uniref:hypothetical protein n=1 Tax=Streptomyces sp. NPDC057757 TaxID=3346241 RepID=UPI0036823FF6